MNFDPFTKKVDSTMKRYGMLPDGAAALVGLSGGADSMTLLSVLQQLAPEHGWAIVALHVNHGIRGQEADRDENFCRNYCEKQDIPFYAAHFNVPAIAKERGAGEEETGRILRYQWFSDMAGELFPDRDVRICTAHNANDAVETALFHLLRGTSLKGMTGIPPVRGNVIRPLIECERAEIEEYCRRNALSYCTDSTNSDVKYARNRIRNVILPEMEKINPAAMSCMARSLVNFSRDEDFLEQETAEVLKQAAVPGQSRCFYTQPVCDAAEAIGMRAVGEILQRIAPVQQDEQHLHEVYDLVRRGSGQVQISSGIMVRVRDGLLAVPGEETADFFYVGDSPLELPYGIFETQVFSAGEQIAPVLLENALDYDKLMGDFIVRNRRPGDRFRPRKRGVTKSLKALFQERGIPPEERSSVTLMECQGKIIWMEGFGPAEGFAAGPETKHILLVSVKRKPAK